MDNQTNSPDRIDPLLGLDPIENPLAARDAVLSLLGDIDALAASAMNGTGLDPRVRALIEQYPGSINAEAFKLKLGFAMAERAVDMADNDPEEAADLLKQAVKILGARAPSASTLAASTHKPHGFSKAILGALLYATRLNKDPKSIAKKAHELIEKIKQERQEALEAKLGSHGQAGGILNGSTSSPSSGLSEEDDEGSEEPVKHSEIGFSHSGVAQSTGGGAASGEDPLPTIDASLLPAADISAKLSNAATQAATQAPTAATFPKPSV